jgi:hypothetical protein
VSFATRDALMTATSYTEAVSQLSSTKLIADVYYIVAGTSTGQGAVISRNRTTAVNVWNITESKFKWFVLETNYDHWKPAPWYDDRRDAAIEALHQLGQQDVKSGALLHKVLSVKPVLNIQTVYR